MIRVLVLGDMRGVPQLAKHLPAEAVCGIVGAAVRPQAHDGLREIAAHLGVPFVIQPVPASPRYPAFRQAVADARPDLIWINSYSMIVREDVLSVPRLGGINIHGGLLPQYRGCNPTQWAILDGAAEVGATLHVMTAGLDEGDILDRRAVPLRFEDTWVEAQARIDGAIESLIAENLGRVLAGSWRAVPQDAALARYCRRRTPEDGRFSWDQRVIDIYHLVRAVAAPHPGAFHLDARGERVVIDRWHSPAELATLKYGAAGGCELRGEAVRLRPLPDRDAARVRFEMEDLSGRPAGSCALEAIDWARRTAVVSVRAEGTGPAARGVAPDAARLLAAFADAELGIAHLRAADLAEGRAA